MLSIKNIQNFAHQYDLWSNGSRIVVGVSGGPDSICLLDILSKLAKKCDFEIHIAHVNYQLRGKESDKDEKIVKEYASKYNIPVSVLRPNKELYNGNLENNLREIRYSFFEEMREKLNYDLIAVAHNQNDQAETVLMRMMRGSGLNGLSAIKPKSGNIIRPLLNTSREDILEYCKKHELIYGIDKSNEDIKFTRNKIRHELLPYLKQNFNIGLTKTLAEWSISVADDYDYIQQEAERFVNSACKNKRDNCIYFLAGDFLEQHAAIQRQVIRVIFERLNGSLIDVENKQVEEIIKVVKSSKNKAQKAFIGGLNILKKNDNIDIFC